ncbi:MAG: hypothetical protein GY765_16595 [bacterium]|nr:hypothetical protein [bacterium]
MKTKKMKLELKKKTISNLNTGKMMKLNGGLATNLGIGIPVCSEDCGSKGCGRTDYTYDQSCVTCAVECYLTIVVRGGCDGWQQ